MIVGVEADGTRDDMTVAGRRAGSRRLPSMLLRLLAVPLLTTRTRGSGTAPMADSLASARLAEELHRLGAARRCTGSAYPESQVGAKACCQYNRASKLGLLAFPIPKRPFVYQDDGMSGFDSGNRKRPRGENPLSPVVIGVS